MNLVLDEALAAQVRQIAEHAGRAIMEIYDAGFEVFEKDDRSPLTAADLAAHRLICEALLKLTPHIPVLSEESAAASIERRREWTQFWLVDPLDGTREFVKRNGEFSVNIALVENHRSVLGVVHAPVPGYSCVGAMGLGARRHERDGSHRAIHVAEQRHRELRVAGSRSHADRRLLDVLERIGTHTLCPMGSALKFCLIAGGEADVYFRFGPTSEWDTAAGQAVVEAAGGRVTDMYLRALRYNQRDTLLNPDFLAFADDDAPWQKWIGSAHVASNDE
ncbi:MAG: 3'(2'),5'-bisphosphate nucleotidase CysQ [Pseudomonadota bacterium]|nr:3'(2'),5'-bisphosphate nucleotidase CysQ [Pseudomonadota bacterium]